MKEVLGLMQSTTFDSASLWTVLWSPFNLQLFTGARRRIGREHTIEMHALYVRWALVNTTSNKGCLLQWVRRSASSAQVWRAALGGGAGRQRCEYCVCVCVCVFCSAGSGCSKLTRYRRCFRSKSRDCLVNVILLLR